MSKKIFTIAVMLVMVFSVALTACQPTATEQPAEEPAAEEEMEEPAEEEMEEEDMEEEMEEEEMEEPTAEPEVMGVPLSDLDGTTVLFWHVWGTGQPSEGMTAIVDDFNANNEYGITVEAVDQGHYSDAEDAMNAAIQSGDVPDVIVGYQNALAGWYSVDAVVDIQPYIEDGVVGLTQDQIDDFYEGAFNSGVIADGARIGMPLSQSTNVIFYNNTWAEELGFDSAPTTPEEFQEQACAAAEANNTDDDPNNDGTGGLVLYPSASNVASWTYAYGGDFLNETGDGYDFTNQEVEDVAYFLKTLWDEGCAFPTESYPNPEFATRKALFTMSSSAGLPYQLAAFDDEAATDDEWSFIAFPGPGDQSAVDAFGQSVAIVNSTPEKKLAAWLFLKHFTSPETQATWINSSAYYPVRKSTTDLIGDYITENPKWETGLELLEVGRSEPALASWGSVRRAVGDAFDVILQSAPDEIPSVLEDLNNTAAELVAEVEG
jgi:ABC-type glycerol-3-phosphate transport system substrate-binding protein